MKLIRLLVMGFSLSLRRELAHRANIGFAFVLTAMGMLGGLASLAAVFFHTESLAGWSPVEALVLLGTYSITSGLLQTFVEPNLSWFAGQVTNGLLDDLLLKPVPSLFSATLGTCSPFGLTQSVLGMAMVGVGMWVADADVSLEGVASFVMLLAAGVAVMWGSRSALASLAFWSQGFDPTLMYFPVWQLGRYPTGIYPRAVRWALTYAVPVALVAAVPSRSLTRGISVPLLLASLGIAAGVVLITSIVWSAGLRRYTSATS